MNLKIEQQNLSFETLCNLSISLGVDFRHRQLNQGKIFSLWKWRKQVFKIHALDLSCLILRSTLCSISHLPLWNTGVTSLLCRSCAHAFYSFTKQVFFCRNPWPVRWLKTSVTPFSFSCAKMQWMAPVVFELHLKTSSDCREAITSPFRKLKIECVWRFLHWGESPLCRAPWITNRKESTRIWGKNAKGSNHKEGRRKRSKINVNIFQD